MTIDEEAVPGEEAVGSLLSRENTVPSIRTIDHTSAHDPITSTSRSQRHRTDPDSSDSGEGKPLLTDSVPVTIDASIGKLRKMHKAENTAEEMDGGASPYQKNPVDEDSGTEPTSIDVVPPDGGLRAWMIMIGSFTINGVLFSIINTYSLIYPELQKRLTEVGETEVSSKSALVGSLTIGTTFFLSPVAGILTDKFGIQMTTFAGGVIASTGLLLSSLLIDKVELLYLTYGVMYGLGASLAYTPSLVILGHYFKKYLGLVNGVVTAGSSVFTTLIPYLMEFLLRRLGLEGLLRCMAVLTAVVMACAILFKPIPLTAPRRTEPQLKSKSLRSRLKKFVNVSIWKRKRYVVWACSIPLALFGYFVPYVHIGKFVTTMFKDADGKLPIMCIGITSGVGRLIFGYIADLPRVNRILLQQISFLSIGILTMLLPVTKSFLVLLAISLAMGLFDGCFISLLGPIAFDICGRSGATQAIGFLLGMCSIPLTVGPPIAGLLYDHTGSYTLPFLLAGVPPIVGALTMFLIRCVKENEEINEDVESSNDVSTENSPSKADCQNGRMRTNGFTSAFIVDIEQKCQPVTQKRYSAVCRHQRSCSECCCVQQQTGPQGCVTRDSYRQRNSYTDCSRYSESVPLLHNENTS